MPASDNISLPYVSRIVSSLSPASALDVGIGMGKFGFVFREASEWSKILSSENSIERVSKENWRCCLDGVEVCREYITPIQEYLYNNIYIGPAQQIVANLGSYDLIHLGDVIEHFEKSEGQRLLDLLFEKAKLGVLIVTPVGGYEQEGIVENPYEEHKSVWDCNDFRRFPCVWVWKVAKRQWVIFISRYKYWFRDPLSPRKTQKHLLKTYVRQKIKRVCKSLFGCTTCSKS